MLVALVLVVHVYVMLVLVALVHVVHVPRLAVMLVLVALVLVVHMRVMLVLVALVLVMPGAVRIAVVGVIVRVVLMLVALVHVVLVPRFAVMLVLVTLVHCVCRLYHGYLPTIYPLWLQTLTSHVTLSPLTHHKVCSVFKYKTAHQIEARFPIKSIRHIRDAI